MIASAQSLYCPPHARLSRKEAAAFAAELSEASAHLDTPEQINAALKLTFRALITDRITARKAGTLGYLGQLMLFSHREVVALKKSQLDLRKQEEADQRHKKFLEEQEARRQRIANNKAEERRAAEAEAEAARVAAARAESKRKREQKLAAQTAARTKTTEQTQQLAREHTPASTKNSAAEDATARALAAIESRLTSATTAAQPSMNHSQPKPEPKPAPKPEPDTSSPSFPPDFFNHFYPIDPSLKAGLQDLRKNIPPPDAEELRWRELSRRYSRRRF
jgi:hypothetical protein